MRKILTIIISIVWVIPLLADDFDPANPPEPYTKYKVETSASPYGYTSGGGMYVSDTEVTISTSAYSQNYTFSHWTKNGEYYSDQQSFSYIVETQKTSFVAIYDYTPVNPSEPQASNEYRLYLTNNISSACSFNRTSGAKVEAGTNVTVTAYSSSNYEFLGWYENDEKISDALSFSYLMPESNVTLTAKFIYNPLDPDDPDSSTDDVDNTELGDVNEDGNVDIVDLACLISYLNDSTPSKFNISAADVDGSKTITTDDVTELRKIILEKK